MPLIVLDNHYILGIVSFGELNCILVCLAKNCRRRSIRMSYKTIKNAHSARRFLLGVD